MWIETGTCIAKLQVRSSGTDTPTLRLAVSAHLAGAELEPPGKSPTAVLIVRRLADPLPGRLASKPTARIDSTWERAVRNRLAECYAHAARPSQGSVPADAEAVLFSDEAEMLACMVLDMSRWEARQRWWWQTPLRGLPDAASGGITTLLCRQAAQSPAVLHQLSQRGQAVTVLQSLAPGQAMAILVATGRAYDLPELHLEQLPPPPAATTIPEWKPAASVQRAAGEEGGAPLADHRTIPSSVFTMPPSSEVPWQDWLPAGLSLSELTREQACLLGVGLGLYRAPAVVRSSGFMRKLRDWWLATVTPTVQPKSSSQTANQPSGQPSPPISPQPTTQPQHSTKQPVEEVTPATLPKQRAITAKPPPSVQPIAGIKSGAAEHKPPPSQVSGRAVDYPEQPQPGEPATYASPTVRETPQALTLPPQTVEPPSLARQEMLAASAEPVFPVTVNSPSQPLAQVTQPPSVRVQTGSPVTETNQQDERIEAAWLLANGVTTRLGGVWYLINLMAYLDLPDCFENEWRLATRLGAWGTLEALARALLAESDSAPLEDPLWLALAELSGRQPGEALGAGLPENADFRLPVAWLTHSDNSDQSAYAWASDGQRLRLWSEQSYLLIEVARSPLETAAQAAAELRRYRGEAPFQLDRQCFDDAPLACLDGPLTAGLSPSLRRWLERVTPYLRWRLRRALPGGGADDPREWLFHRGQLYVTSTHVDLVMSLDDISVPLRLAGLDRDPGWLPEFGRVIKFYFE